MRNVNLLVLSASLIVCGCTSKGSNSSASLFSSSASISGVVSAGPVSGATINIYSINSDGSQGSQLGTAITDANGRYALSMPASGSPVLVVASGGSYTEEASGLTVNMGSAQMRTALTSVIDGQQVGVTPVTEIATQNALALIASNSAVSPVSIINNSNTTVASALGLSDITLPPADPTQVVAGSDDSHAAQYALVLASLSQLAKSTATTNSTNLNSLDLMQALATTFTYQGNFQGSINGTDIPVSNGTGASLTLSTVLGGATNFAGAMATAMNTVAPTLPTGFNDPSLVPLPNYTVDPPISGDLSGIDFDFPIPPATLPGGRPTDSGPPSLPAIPPRYIVGGTITGLNGRITLQNNGKDDLIVIADGSFQFSHKLFQGANYNVTVQLQPIGQLCTMSNGSGTITGGDVSSVAISCASTITIFDGVGGASNSAGVGIATDSQGNTYIVGRSTPGIDGLSTSGFANVPSTMIITKYDTICLSGCLRKA